jgi:hypothetical protein
MKNINIDFTGIGIALLALTALTTLVTISWVMIEQTTLENETKRKMFEYELKEKELKIQNDSINLESLKKWNNMPSQYWEGRGEE